MQRMDSTVIYHRLNRFNTLPPEILLRHILTRLDTAKDILNVARCNRKLWRIITNDDTGLTAEDSDCLWRSRYMQDFRPDAEECQRLAVFRMRHSTEQVLAAAVAAASMTVGVMNTHSTHSAHGKDLAPPSPGRSASSMLSPFESSDDGNRRRTIRSVASFSDLPNHILTEPVSWYSLYRRRAVLNIVWRGGELCGQWAPSVFGETVKDVLYLDLCDVVHDRQEYIARRALVQRLDGKGFLLLEGRAPSYGHLSRPYSRHEASAKQQWRWSSIRELPWRGWRADEEVRFDYRRSRGMINAHYAVVTAMCIRAGSPIDWTWCTLAWRIRDGRLLHAHTHLAEPARFQLDGRLLCSHERRQPVKKSGSSHGSETDVIVSCETDKVSESGIAVYVPIAMRKRPNETVLEYQEVHDLEALSIAADTVDTVSSPRSSPKLASTPAVRYKHSVERDPVLFIPIRHASEDNAVVEPRRACHLHPVAIRPGACERTGIFEHWFADGKMHWRLLAVDPTSTIPQCVRSGSTTLNEPLVAQSSRMIDHDRILLLAQGPYTNLHDRSKIDQNTRYLAVFSLSSERIIWCHAEPDAPEDPQAGIVLPSPGLFLYQLPNAIVTIQLHDGRICRSTPIDPHVVQPALRIHGTFCFVGFDWRNQQAIILDAASGELYYHRFPVLTVAHGPNFSVHLESLCYYAYAGLLMTRPNYPF
jgi:hypothetical protein